jgi:hypothetical protein
MSLYQELENACRTLKHTPENIDPTELRTLLRRTQATIEALEPLLDAHTLTIQQIENGGYINYHITITGEYDKTQYLNLLETITQQ